MVMWLNFHSAFFKGNALLPLVAAVHDSFKFVDGVQHLGLHEVLSTHVGSELLISALQVAEQKGLIKFEVGELEVLNKLAKRAIYTHGNGEFPEVTSSPYDYVDEVEVRELFGSLYIKPGQRSYPSNMSAPLTKSQEVISGMNLADILVGAQMPSLIKYNLSWKSEIVCESTLEKYLNTRLLASFSGNITPIVAVYLHEHMQEGYAVVAGEIEEYGLRAGLLIALLDPDAHHNLDSNRYHRAQELLALHKDFGFSKAVDDLRAAFTALGDDTANIQKRNEFNACFMHLVTLVQGVDVHLTANAGN